MRHILCLFGHAWLGPEVKVHQRHGPVWGFSVVLNSYHRTCRRCGPLIRTWLERQIYAMPASIESFVATGWRPVVKAVSLPASNDTQAPKAKKDA